MTFLSENWPALLFLGLMAFGVAIAWQLRNRYSIVAEFFQFLGQRKLWWMAPIVIVMLFISVMIVAGVNSPLALIYIFW